MEESKSLMIPTRPPSQILANSHGPEVVASENLRQSAPQMQLGNSPEAVPPGALPEVVPPYGKIPENGKSDDLRHFAKHEQQKTTCCGITPRWWLLIGALLLVGAGVGLGIGFGLRSNPPRAASPTNSTSPSSTPTNPSTTNSPSTAPVTSGTTGVAAYNCTSTTPFQYTTSDGTNFTEHCGVDWTNGTRAADGNGTVQDISQVLAYTIESCVANCVAWNWNAVSTHSDILCNAVTYNANLTSSFPKHKANCWLKTKHGVDRVETGTPIASAAMVSD